MKPTKALFAKAKELLATGQLGWNKNGNYYDVDRDGRVCACLLGAVAYAADPNQDGRIRSATDAGDVGLEYDDYSLVAVVEHVRTCVRNTVPAFRSPGRGVVQFNDNPTTKLDDVLKVLDCAIECAPEA